MGSHVSTILIDAATLGSKRVSTMVYGCRFVYGWSMGVISLGTLLRWMERTVAMFVLQCRSMLLGVVESGLMAAFFE